MSPRAPRTLAMLLASLTACERAATPTTDAAVDATRTDVANALDIAAPIDAPEGGVADAGRCPDARPFGACAAEGLTCDYRDPRPGCGGINLSCRGGQWTENFHADPGAGCFDAAVAADVGADAARDVTSVDDARDGALVTDAAAPADAGNPCATAGGLCVSSATACANGGGTARDEGAAGCRFSDGNGVCCVPPEPQPAGEACAARGGLCAPIAGCNFVGGSFAPQSGSGCSGVGVVCCLPAARCGAEDQLCCGDTASFRPACDRGVWRCTLEGTRLVPRAMCTF
ncbi:MAG: hypothetical protein U0325_11805 [Polyangiales bacterium]